MKIYPQHLAPAFAILASANAMALDVNITGYAVGSGTVAVSYSGADTYFIGGVYNAQDQIGQLAGTLNGVSFLTYCAEIFQNLSVPGSYNDYSIDMPWSATVQTNMNKLFSYAASIPLPTTGAQSAAMQAAVWEVLYESAFDTAGLGFATGDFTVTAGTADLGSINWAAVAAQTITHTVSNLHSESGQDLVLITAVPEASTYAMMLAGLAVVGFVAGRRKPDA